MILRPIAGVLIFGVLFGCTPEDTGTPQTPRDTTTASTDTVLDESLLREASVRLAQCPGVGNAVPTTRQFQAGEAISLNYQGYAQLDGTAGPAATIRLYAPASPFLHIEVDALDANGEEIEDYQFGGTTNLQIRTTRCPGNLPPVTRIFQIDGQEIEERQTQSQGNGANQVLSTEITHLSDFYIGWP